MRNYASGARRHVVTPWTWETFKAVVFRSSTLKSFKGWGLKATIAGRI